MNPNIPKWIIGLVVVMALAAFGISFQLMTTEDFSHAARNAIPAVLTVVTLAAFRHSIIAFIMILVGRITIEFSDLVTGLTVPSSDAAGMVPMVIGFLVVELFALYILVKKLRAEQVEKQLENQVA